MRMMFLPNDGMSPSTRNISRNLGLDLVEISPNVKVRVVRSTVKGLVAKTEPVKGK